MSFAAENLTCLRGGRLVFQDLSFSLAPGEALLIQGPNGSGKSSLLKLCAGLIPMAKGRLLRAGRDVAADAESHRHNLAYVGHLDAVKPILSVRDNLKIWVALYGAPSSDMGLETALDRLDLLPFAHLQARLLSAGQKRRLNLARLLVQKANLWLLDEPTVSLDSMATETIRFMIAEHQAQGGIVLATSHIDLGIAAQQLTLGNQTTNQYAS